MRAEFDESLVTGNEMIDTQHKELIDKINKLLDSCETSKEKVVAVKTLDYLADYTEFHFGEEEKLQESINYPAIAEHKKEHDKLRAVVKDLYFSFGSLKASICQFHLRDNNAHHLLKINIYTLCKSPCSNVQNPQNSEN